MPAPISKSALSRLVVSRPGPLFDLAREQGADDFIDDREVPPHLRGKLFPKRPRPRPFVIPPKTPEVGYERSAATLPVCETPVPDDTTLFASPAGDVQLYLPRYRLRLITPDRYDLGLVSLPESGFRLTLGLERFPAEGIPLPAGAGELPHELSVTIDYSAPSGLAKSLALDDVLLEDGKVRSVSAKLTLAERDLLLQAFATSGVTLRFFRSAKVAALLPQAGGGVGGPLRLMAMDGVRPQLQPHLLELVSTLNTPTPEPVRAPPAAAPLLNLQLNTAMAAMTIKPLAFDKARLKTEFDLREVIEPASTVTPTPAPPPAPRYHDLLLALPQPVDADPLVLPPQAHAYFYQGLTGGGGAELRSLRMTQVIDGVTESHVYFQDPDERDAFYFLPDAMRLERAAELPFHPQMKVRLSTPDGTLAGALATIDYVLSPAIRPARLEDAAAQLMREVPPGANGTSPPPRLLPLTARLALKLRLPGPAASQMATFEDLAGDLASGVRHSLTVPLAQFRQLFAAGFSTDATSLFSGELAVGPADRALGRVPVDVRFVATEGPLLDVDEHPGADGMTSVILRNGTESPLRIRALPITLASREAESSVAPEGLDLSQPVVLEVLAELAFRAAAPGVAEGTTRLVFDLDQIDILATPETILPVISDTSVPAEYLRMVEVMSLPELLDADHPDGPVVMINVEFENGDPVRITPAAPSALATVRLPMANILLGRDTKGAYRYRQQVIRRSGAQIADAEWRTADFGALVVPVAP